MVRGHVPRAHFGLFSENRQLSLYFIVPYNPGVLVLVSTQQKYDIQNYDVKSNIWHVTCLNIKSLFLLSKQYGIQTKYKINNKLHLLKIYNTAELCVMDNGWYLVKGP